MVHHKDIQHHISSHLNGLSHKSELNFKEPQVKHDKKRLMKMLLSSFHLKGHLRNGCLQWRRNVASECSVLFEFYGRRLRREQGERETGLADLDCIFARVSFHSFILWILLLQRFAVFINFLGPNFGLCN